MNENYTYTSELELQKIIIDLTKENLSLKTQLKSTEESRYLFADVAEQWLSIHSTRIRKSTYLGYRRHFNNHLFSYFFGKFINDISAEEIEQFYKDKLNEGLSANSVLKIKATLNQIFNYAFNHKIINQNPIMCAEAPSKIKFEAQRLTIEQLNNLLKLAKNESEAYPAILLASTFGLRRGETLGLKKKNIDFKNHILNIKNTYNESYDSDLHKNIVFGEDKTKTPKSNRKLIIPDKVETEIIKIMAQQEVDKSNNKKYNTSNSDILCVNKKGDRLTPNFVTKELKRLTRKLNYSDKLRFQDLRHTYASILSDYNISIEQIKKLLGHSNIMTTSKYVHPTINSDIADTVDNIININN